MADYRVHLSQAKHNEEVAKKLVRESPYHDWGITAGFYSAIHYFECWLFNREEKHTETSIPVKNGKFKYTPHAWREKIVERDLSKRAFKSFRKLRDASETARYLSLYRVHPGMTPGWLDRPAPDYFSPEKARNLVEKSLENHKIELGKMEEREMKKEQKDTDESKKDEKSKREKTESKRKDTDESKKDEKSKREKTESKRKDTDESKKDEKSKREKTESKRYEIWAEFLYPIIEIFLIYGGLILLILLSRC